MRNPSEIWKKRTVLFMTSQAISLFGSSLVSYAILVADHPGHPVRVHDDPVSAVSVFCRLFSCPRSPVSGLTDMTASA